MKKTLAVLAAILLVACGGDSGERVQGYKTLRQDYLNIVEAVGLEQPIEPSTLPVSGSAIYAGSLFIGTPNGPDILGDLDLTANFANATISGRATEFRDNERGVYDGRLDITGGDIDRTANLTEVYTFIADLDGRITEQDTGDFYNVDAFLVGDFFGPDQRYVFGIARGDVTSNVGDFELESENASFAAEKK